MSRTPLLLFALAGCGHPAPHDTCAPTPLRPLAWAGSNRDDLTRWLDGKGCKSASFDPAARPIALFDWDNTVVKNDFGDAVTMYAITHDKILAPRDWKDTSRFLTPEAAAALAKACAGTPAGTPIPTSKNAPCADEIFAVYDGKTTSGQPAFAGEDHLRIEPAYAWTDQLLAGHTPDEVAQIARDAITAMLAAPVGTKQTVGTHTDVTGWLRFYDEEKDLIAALHSRGFDVWVITASPQIIIQQFSPEVGIPADRVIGIRPIVDNGKLTAHLEGCGPIKDGEDGVIPYIEGKRCWVNKVVFGDTSDKAIERRPDGHRQTFAAGDSDSDRMFVGDATYKLVIDRHKASLMCYAKANAGDSWRINPMFLEPMAPQTAPYACATDACWDRAGAKVPCVDDAGAVIPDQRP